MHIQELILHIRHVADQQALYCITLGLPLLAESTDSFSSPGRHDTPPLSGNTAGVHADADRRELIGQA